MELQVHNTSDVLSMPRIVINYSDNYLVELRERLTEYGITQRQLSEEAGIDETMVSRWFAKNMMPRLESIVKIEQAIARLRRRQKRKQKRDEK